MARPADTIGYVIRTAPVPIRAGVARRTHADAQAGSLALVQELDSGDLCISLFHGTERTGVAAMLDQEAFDRFMEAIAAAKLAEAGKLRAAERERKGRTVQ